MIERDKSAPACLPGCHAPQAAAVIAATHQAPHIRPDLPSEPFPAPAHITPPHPPVRSVQTPYHTVAMSCLIDSQPDAPILVTSRAPEPYKGTSMSIPEPATPRPSRPKVSRVGKAHSIAGKQGRIPWKSPRMSRISSRQFPLPAPEYVSLVLTHNKLAARLIRSPARSSAHIPVFLESRARCSAYRIGVSAEMCRDVCRRKGCSSKVASRNGRKLRTSPKGTLPAFDWARTKIVNGVSDSISLYYKTSSCWATRTP